jgi:uncharacterized protein DUF559
MPSGIYRRTRLHRLHTGRATSLVWNRPGYRARQVRKRKKTAATIKWKRHHGMKMSKAWRDPKRRKRWHKSLSVVRKRMWKDPAYRKKQVAERKSRWRDPKFKRKHSRTCARAWRRKEYAERCKYRPKFGPSKIQISLFKFLCRMGVKLLSLEFQVGPYFIDIALPCRKIAIEIDGAHWHQNKVREKRRNRYLRRNGWSVRHFPAKKSSKNKILEYLGVCV